MKCTAAKKMISDCIDNGLDSTQRRSLEEHLGGCVECQKLFEDFKKITVTAKGLKEFSPPDQTWFKIATQIKEKQTEALRPVRPKLKRTFLSIKSLGWAVSAALLLAIVVGAVTFGPRIWEKDASPQKFVLSKLEEAESYYKKAIESLWEAVSAQKESFDPDLFAVFQKNLKIIDDSILACREAVLSRPDNIDSRNYLLAAYKEKSELLEEMMAASTSSVDQRDVGSIY
ncbi:MAG: zf-HC2 domain-containing protein [Candidatus Aminicenantes bacterium]|jgi:hypothetical protein